MTMTWIRPVQLSLGAVALCMASWAGAQTAAPADGAAPPPPANVAPKPKAKHAGAKHHGQHHGEKAKHHKKHADPAQREAAAVREESRNGKPAPRTQEEQLQRNALARCDVFKSDSDRQACSERVRNGQVSGSVKDGGTITEYTQQVPAR